MAQRTLALTADLGNSRAKLCLFDLPDVRQVDAFRAEPRASMTLDWGAADARQVEDRGKGAAELGASLTAWLRRELRGEDCALELAAVSSVAGSTQTELVCDVLLESGARAVHRSPEVGLVNSTRTPETVGHDRLYAARGGVEWHARRYSGAEGAVAPGLLVVDAGTALTVDAVAFDGSSRARFLGGAIAPGPMLLADSLARRAAQLPAVEPEPGARALGRDTLEAIRAGVVVGFRGAASSLTREVAREAQLESAPILLTGGARLYLLEPSPCLKGGELIVDPWLVERGLLAAALEAHGR